MAYVESAIMYNLGSTKKFWKMLQKRCIKLRTLKQAAVFKNHKTSVRCRTFELCSSRPTSGSMAQLYIFLKKALSHFFIYFRLFKHTNLQQIGMWKMSIQYTVPGFELTTCGAWVSSHNHQTRTPAHFQLCYIYDVSVKWNYRCQWHDYAWKPLELWIQFAS